MVLRAAFFRTALLFTDFFVDIKRFGAGVLIDAHHVLRIDQEKHVRTGHRASASKMIHKAEELWA